MEHETESIDVQSGEENGSWSWNANEENDNDYMSQDESYSGNVSGMVNYYFH